jgi:hypothetical protein
VNPAGRPRTAAANYKVWHARLTVDRGRPKKCEVCGTDDPTKRYDWASLTKKYDDPADYKRMCRARHARHDNNYPPSQKGMKAEERQWRLES